MKTNVTICIETELYVDAKTKVRNLSKLFNDFLRDYLPTVKGENGSKEQEEQVKILTATLKLMEKKLEDLKNKDVIEVEDIEFTEKEPFDSEKYHRDRLERQKQESM